MYGSNLISNLFIKKTKNLLLFIILILLSCTEMNNSIQLNANCSCLLEKCHHVFSFKPLKTGLYHREELQITFCPQYCRSFLIYLGKHQSMKTFIHKRFLMIKCIFLYLCLKSIEYFLFYIASNN